MTQSIRWLIAGIALLLMCGCATTRTYMPLQVPSAGSAVLSGGKPLVIDSIRDARTFEGDPDDPSTPSLKKGARYALDATQRERAIARKRGGFGHAFGDILLPSGESVVTLTRALLVNAFSAQGYSVVAAAAAPADATRVTADIRQFWAWFTPGMWSASIEARVQTMLTIDGPQGHQRIMIMGYGRNAIQVAREANWRLAYQRAFEDYLKQFNATATSGSL